MNGDRATFQNVVYRVVLVSCAMATVVGLLVIWGGLSERGPDVLLWRLFATSVLIAIASALTVSTTRLANGRRPEDGDG